jgi:predicted protein tyrosine phosphatase
MKSVKVFSKSEFINYITKLEISDDTVEMFPGIAIISITKADAISAFKKPFKKEHKNVLHLAFNDAGENDTDTFTVEHAEQILEFLKEHKDKSLYLVHCDAGISRSGAVGEFIVNFEGLSYYRFKKDNPKVLPNPFILKTLNKLLLNKEYK